MIWIKAVFPSDGHIELPVSLSMSSAGTEQGLVRSMFTNILLPLDGSDASFSAVRQGIALATSLKSRLTALVITVPWAAYFAREFAVVVPDVVVPQSEYDRKSATRAAGILQSVEMEARKADVTLNAVHRSHQSPHSAIVEEAAKQGCDLIVMASHHQPGFTGALLGSETMAVLSRTNIPVLVYRHNSSAQAPQ